MTPDESRLEAAVRGRSARLFEDGYRAAVMEDGCVAVTNPSGDAYRVDPAARTCDCPFFAGKGGSLACKHLLGLRLLLLRQDAYERISISRYRRFYAVRDEQGTLIAVTVYRIGAETLARRIGSLAVCSRCQNGPDPADGPLTGEGHAAGTPVGGMPCPCSR